MSTETSDSVQPGTGVAPAERVTVESLDQRVTELQTVRDDAVKLGADPAQIDAQIEKLAKQRDELQQEIERAAERSKSDLRHELADRVRAYAKSGDRLMADRAALLDTFKRAVEGEALTKEDADTLRADLKLTES
jgi:hypothetical protein